MTWSKAWYAERATYVGASEAAMVVGLSPWGDAIDVWERKTGRAPEKPESFRMKLGDAMEPVIGKLATPEVRELLDAPKLKLLSRRRKPVIRHPGHPFIGANPDFVIDGLGIAKGLVQAKMRLDGAEFGEPDDAGVGLGIPEHYRIQGFAELLATGADFVIFAVLDPRGGLKLLPLNRHASDNEDAIDDLRLDLVEFWQEHIEKDVPPPPTALSGKALARRFPRPEAKVGKIASAEQEQTLRELLEVRQAKKEIEHEEEALKNRVKEMIGSAAFIDGAGQRFSWSRYGGGEQTIVEWEPIAKAYREMLDVALQTPELHVLTPGGVVTLTRDWLDAIEPLYTRTETKEPSDRFTVGKIS